VFLHLRDNLRSRQLVRALHGHNALRRCPGAAEAALELKLRLTWPEQQQRVRLANLADDFVVVLVKVQIVPLLVLLLPAALLKSLRNAGAARRRMSASWW
jgi:hypothetical protein